MRAPENVVLLGDNITQGLGSKKINFTQELQDRLGPCFCVQNLALTGTTIYYPLEIVDESWFPHGGVCVILYGNVDAQIRPNREGKIFPKIPKRFQKSGMLMPRPFYSHSPVKKAVQHGENALRRFFSHLIIRVDGTEQWVNAEDFDDAYRELIGRLREKGFEIFCCSTVFIDEKFFKGTLKQYVIFNGLIQDAAREGGGVHRSLRTLARGCRRRRMGIRVQQRSFSSERSRLLAHRPSACRPHPRVLRAGRGRR